MGKRNKHLKKVWRWFYWHAQWFPVSIGCATIPHLSRPAVLRCAKILAWMGPYITPRDKRLIQANIDFVFPNASPKRKHALLVGTYRNISRVLFDLFWFSKDSAARVLRWAPMSPSWRAALDLPGPKVIVTSHHGNWEMAGHVVVTNGYPLMSVGKQVGTIETTKNLNRFRARLGQEIVLAEGAALPLLRTLRKGKNIAVLTDQHLSKREGGVWTSFLGHPALTAPTPAFFAQRTKGAVIAVAYLQCRPDGTYHGKPPIIIHPKEGETIEELTQRVTDEATKLIRRYPTQWLYAYKRWRDIPAEALPNRHQYPFYARPANRERLSTI